MEDWPYRLKRDLNPGNGESDFVSEGFVARACDTDDIWVRKNVINKVRFSKIYL